MDKKASVWAIALSLTLTLLLSSIGFAYQESPDLTKLVEEGKLPAVEKRLPENPLLMEPRDQVGKYGGTWRRFSTWEEWGFLRMSLYGFSLLRFSEEDLSNQPNLVTEWESNEDKTFWTFHFRKGVKWSDGHPFTVDDFLFWWNEMVLNDDHSFAAPEWARVGGETMEVTKVDDYTLELKFAAPNPFLLDYLCMWSSLARAGAGGMVVYPGHYLKQFHPDYSEEYDDYEIFEQKQEWWHNTDFPVLSAWNPVEEEPGKKLVLERNPYFYAVDTEGNQLPYIDRIVVRYLADNEIFKLKLANGESDMQIRPGVLGLRDIATMKKNESQHNFETLVWDGGSGTGPLFYPNHNHPDPEKRSLYRNPKFLKALSHGVNRPKIQKVIFYGTGYQTTGTYCMKTPDFTRSKVGEEMFVEWRDSAVEYDADKSKGLLDEIGVVDQDGDGWREMPNGEDLKLRIDEDSETSTMYVDTAEIVKQDWRSLGLKTIVNPVDGSKISMMQTNGTFDIRNSWELSDGSSIVGQPEWMLPVRNNRWAPLNGAWWMVQGTDKAGTELDKDPRDRTPPRKKPTPGGPVDRLQQLYKKAKVTPNWEEREKYVKEMVQIHIEEGPFLISTIANWPRVGVVKDYFKNVPDPDHGLKGGWIQDWHLSYIATLKPPQFYIDK